MGPLTIEITRGGRVESAHAVAAAIVDADGRLAFAAGDVETPYYPRSAVKAMLALPLVASGIADRFGLPDRALALACASHAGAPAHVETARAMLAACHHGEDALACGAHWPLSRESSHALAASGGAPAAVHNNCSGKHAGLICLAAGLGAAVGGYEQPDHPAMREAVAACAALTGCAHNARNRAIDGCSIPTHAIPLAAMALGFARFCTGAGLDAGTAAAAGRLRGAVAAHPALLAGEGRLDTVVTAALGERVFIKGGAEGVWCAGLPQTGQGIAVKALDGAGRAAEAAITALLARLLGPVPVLDELRSRPLRNWRGVPVGTTEFRVPGPA